MRRATRLFFVGMFAILTVGSGMTGGDAAFAQVAALGDLEGSLSPFSGPAYRVNSGDQLEISVWREDELQREVMVLPDGTISFPLIGTIKAAGKTATEIEQEISSKLKGNFVDGDVPDVTVAVASTSGLQFSVIGKVRSPGIFTPGRYVTLLEALSFSGGVTEFASLSNIVLVRKSGEILTVVPVNLSNVLRSKSVSAEDVVALPMIRSGDTIIVP
jgi:polysaccharide biosynthesis/export protein